MAHTRIECPDIFTCLEPHVRPSPPAPPRSDQETAREIVANIYVGYGTEQQDVAMVAAALEGAARDAARQERERCAKVAEGRAPNGVCSGSLREKIAAAIRALPPEEAVEESAEKRKAQP